MRARLCLLLALVPAAGCRPRPDGPQVHHGSLAEGDTRIESGEFADAYRVDVRAGQWVTAEMTSSAFGPYLIVRSPSGHPTEHGGEGRAYVRQQATEAGTWTVLATSARAGETGAYTLTVAATDAPPAAPDAPAPRSATRPADLAPSDTGLAVDTTPVFVVRPSRPPSPDAATPGTGAPDGPGRGAALTRNHRGVLEKGDETLESGEYADVIELPLERGQRVEVELASDDFDAYLILQAPSGDQVDNDDASDGTDAKITFTVRETGTHRLSLTTAQVGETGTYRARILVDE